VDPIAAALGADRSGWSDSSGMAAPTELIVTPGPPTGLDRAGPSDPTDRD
jgi:hypothetical protein